MRVTRCVATSSLVRSLGSSLIRLRFPSVLSLLISCNLSKPYSTPRYGYGDWGGGLSAFSVAVKSVEIHETGYCEPLVLNLLSQFPRVLSRIFVVELAFGCAFRYLLCYIYSWRCLCLRHCPILVEGSIAFAILVSLPSRLSFHFDLSLAFEVG